MKGFILTKIHRILFSTFLLQCHGSCQTVKRLPCTLPDLRYFSTTLEKATFVDNQPELLVPLEARSDPRTLSREIVSTETHSVPHPCTWGSNQCTRGDRSRSSHLLTCKTFYKHRVFLYLTVEKVESASLLRLHPSTATIADFTVGEHNHRL